MKTRTRHWPVILLLLAVALVAIIRIRLLAIPLERDEGEFAYGGQLMLQGIPPYQLFYNMKFPGIYAVYALIMALFGQTPAGIHLGLLLVDLANIFLFYKLSRRFQDQAVAAISTASLALLSTSPIVVGMSAHATHFVVLFALGGILVLGRAVISGKPVLFFWSGILMSVACLIKQPGVFFGIFGFCLIAFKALTERERWRIHVLRLASYAVGAILPLVFTGIVLWKAGVFGRFWFWTVSYAKIHATEFPFSAGLRNLAYFLSTIPLTAEGFLWIIAALGLAALLLEQGDIHRKIWLLSFFVSSCLAVAASNYFTRHYFVMLLPALSLLIGEAFSITAQWAARWRQKPAGAPWIFALFILTWLLPVYRYRELFFFASPDEVCRMLFHGNAFVECQELGRHLGQNSSPDATIAVLGSEPEIFFYAHRHSATGYIYMYDFYQPQPDAAGMQREMIQQIEQSKPEYLVFVMDPVSWYLSSDTRRVEGSLVLNWFPAFTKKFYDTAGLILIKPDPEYNWGREAMNHPAFRGPFISVFKRK